MDPPQQMQARQVAHIVNIKDILTGRFVKEDGWSPNYVIVGDTHVSRVNIIGIIISSAQEGSVQVLQIDDGTSKITLRNFEKKFEVDVGNIVLCVGRVRQYGSETYVAPEIINRSINRDWSKVWKRLSLQPSEEIAHVDNTREVIEAQEPSTQSDAVIARIRELDAGDGAQYENVIAAIKDEKIITRLLLQGEIFEIKPGRLKVLE